MFPLTEKTLDVNKFIKDGYLHTKVLDLSLCTDLLLASQAIDFFKYRSTIMIGDGGEVKVSSDCSKNSGLTPEMLSFTKDFVRSELFCALTKVYSGISGIKYTFKKTYKGYYTPWHFDGDQPLDFLGKRRRNVCTMLIYLKSPGAPNNGGNLEFAKIEACARSEEEQKNLEPFHCITPRSGDVVVLDSCSPLVQHRATSFLGESERIFLFIDMLR